MFEVRRFKGHSKLSTTESVYAHLLEDDHSDAIEPLAYWLQRNQNPTPGT